MKTKQEKEFKQIRLRNEVFSALQIIAQGFETPSDTIARIIAFFNKGLKK